MSRLTLALVGLLAIGCNADVYLHNPRGSNNRLNEQGATRANGNRLFDSQNNNRGGYNVCDKTDAAYNEHAPLGTDWTHAFNPTVDTAQQYQLNYFEGSELWVEWTNQHGCGGASGRDPVKTHCHMALQYMCDTDGDRNDPNVPMNPHYGGDMALHVDIHDGGNTNAPDEAGANPGGNGGGCIGLACANAGGIVGTVAANAANNRGTHESVEYYFECRTRERNRGLFLADQNLQGTTAKYTRQNPNGNRNGLECPEERDYLPYWHPSPWRDIAMLTDMVESYCPIYLANSMNVAEKWKCVDTTGAFTPAIIAANTPAACASAGANAQWKSFKHDIPAPECKRSGYTRVNSLGNGVGTEPLRYKWHLPQINDLVASGVKMYEPLPGHRAARCVLRLRYNITTDDYDPIKTNATWNDDENAQPHPIQSPVTQDPVVDVGVKFYGLQLAINTNQFGRTFQDRSHVFYVRERPSNFAGKHIYNLNVRGKRGNIVQTFPSVEYDFMPNKFTVEEGNLVHVQWCGSNTHNNNPGGGDGQAGDAGEGTGGTDRHNFVQALDAGSNFPLALDATPRLATADMGSKQNADYGPIGHKNIFDHTVCYDIDGSEMADFTPNSKHHKYLPCQLALATSGYYRSMSDVSTKAELNVLLNNAPASFVNGVLLEFTPGSQGIYRALCTRNNNFSNRSQKMMLNVAAVGEGGNDMGQ